MKEYKVIKIIKKGKKYLTYFDNDETEYSLTEDQIVEYRIIVGNIIDDKTLKKLKKSVNESTLYNKILHYIDFKPRTEKEIIKYLKEHEADEETISSIVKKLTRIKYLDDKRYASSFVNESIRKQKGKNYIIQQLNDKGVEENYIYEALKVYEYDLEKENVLFKAIKYAKTLTKYPIKRQKQKLTEKLIVDGYSFELINYSLSEVELVDESIELLEKEYNKLLLKGFDNNKIIQKLLAKGFDYSSIKKML